MNEDLKWLAENVHEWNLKKRLKICAHKNVDGSFFAAWTYPADAEGYTRDQWQAARDELAAQKQWSGPEDGVPPVGLWVQFKQIDETGEDLDGLECYVISNGTDESGYKVTTVYFEQHGYKAFMSGCFRPIRTEEDKAVEEMMRIYHANESVSVRDAMRDIYRAGYHKQEDE